MVRVISVRCAPGNDANHPHAVCPKRGFTNTFSCYPCPRTCVTLVSAPNSPSTGLPDSMAKFCGNVALCAKEMSGILRLTCQWNDKATSCNLPHLFLEKFLDNRSFTALPNGAFFSRQMQADARSGEFPRIRLHPHLFPVIIFMFSLISFARPNYKEGVPKELAEATTRTADC